MMGFLFFFSLLGVFNGFLLSLYLFFFAKQKSLSKYLLGALVLALSLRIGKSVLLYFDRDLPKIYLQIGLSACLFIGPFLYFYLKTVLNKLSVFPKSWKWVLALLSTYILVLGIARPYPLDPLFWNEFMVHSIYVVWLIFLVLGGFSLRPVWRKGFNLLPYEKWLLAVYTGNVMIAMAFFMAFFGSSMAYYISGPLVFSFFIYLLAFGYFNEGWFEITSSSSTIKYANKKIEVAESALLISQLNALMREQSLYKNSNLKLQEVAEELGISSHRLSQLLNDNMQSNYSAFINEYRINAACDLLINNEQLSLEGIGYEVGFRSKSTFFTTFKKFKGLTPSQYRNQTLTK